MVTNQMNFHIRLATQADIPALLDFERDNRTFFERFVPPRPQSFFETTDAFQSRMLELLADQLAGVFLMFILLDSENCVIGRVNLTISEEFEAAVGYRIGQVHTGERLAFRALKRIEPMTVQKYNLVEMTAEASLTNPASVQTLINAGFCRVHGKMRSVMLHNAPIILHGYEKELTTSS